MSQLPIRIHLPDGFLDEEIRNGYTISHEMKEIWAVELDLLVEFDKVCKENGLKYFASCGKNNFTVVIFSNNYFSPITINPG